MKQGVLGGFEGNFEEETMSELSFKGQGMAPAARWYHEHPPHTMRVHKSGVMEERTSPVAQRTRAPGVGPAPRWRDVRTCSLCTASVQAVWGLA